MRHNSRAFALESGGCNHGAHLLQLLKPGHSRVHSKRGRGIKEPVTATREEPEQQ